MPEQNSSSLQVLLTGNNPNILFYTSRFQSGKNIELYHVSDSKSDTFEIDTLTYGKQKFKLENHFTSVAHLCEALAQTDESSDLKLDLVILSTSSLQDLSSLPTQLEPLVNNDTKIFIESSSYVQLEPFIKNSKEFKDMDIFSILTDYDIRQTGQSNVFQQFISDTTNDEKFNIYLGGKMFNGQTKKKKTLSLKDSNKYSSNTIKIISTFEALFQKLFSSDIISSCHYSYTEFLSVQWNLAISKICLDPLLILFEETKTAKLADQVLAKPLISGIITEIITIAKKMNVKFNNKLDNEDKLLNHWLNEYKEENVPALLYSYIERTSCLNIDLLLLQPILLADDYDIKTPYLEFLYTIMCQMDKLNKDESEWFTRIENVQKYKQQILILTDQRDKYVNECNNLALDLEAKEEPLKDNKSNEEMIKKDLAIKETEINQLKDEYEIILHERDNQILLLQEQLNKMKLDVNDNVSQSTINSVEVKEAKENDYGSVSMEPLNLPDEDSGILANSSVIDTEVSFDEREKELEKKENELREREESFQRKMAAQQHQQQCSPQFQSPLQHPIQLQTSPALYQNTSTFPTPPQMQNLPHLKTLTPPERSQNSFNQFNNNSSRTNHSTPTITVDRFIDPISSGSMDLNSPFDVTGFQHPIKPTSRKNKNYRITSIGNASNIGYSNVINQFPNNRVSSLPSNGMMQSSSATNLSMIRNNNMIDMPKPGKIGSNSMSPSMSSSPNLSGMVAQRDTSTSTYADTSMTSSNEISNDSIRKPIMQFGLGLHSQTSLTTPLDKTTIPKNIEPIHFSSSTNASQEQFSEEEPPKEQEKTKKKKKFSIFGKKK